MALQQVESALAAADWDNASVAEKIEMLVEIATGLQVRPKTAADILGALRLYDRALDLCPQESTVLAARIKARRGSALQALPNATLEQLEEVAQAFATALGVLNGHAGAEEVAEIEMNLGLIKHTLASYGKGRLNESVAHYQRALRTFTRERFPAEYATLHNNLATAYLAMPSNDQTGRLREALAVQSFEAALECVSLEEYPNEYAMLQNNLGNALQNSATGHVLANRARAIQAYEEALKVRNAANQPGAYANTIANLASCLANLPDDIEKPELGNAHNFERARQLYLEALRIFRLQGEVDKVAAMEAALHDFSPFPPAEIPT